MGRQTKQRKVKARDDNGKPICGAKTRSGGVCRINPMANGRCRFHGGLSTGAPVGNQNALKHGLYSDYFTEDEARDLDQIKLGTVEEELKLCRIKLRRWLKFENKVEQELDHGNENAGMLLDEDERKTVETVDPDAVQEFVDDKGQPTEPPVPLQGVKRKRKRINIEDNIDRLLRRIESLERTRHMLLLADEGHDYEAELRKQLDEDE